MTKLADLSSDGEISTHDYVRKYAKQMLKNTIFLGHFKEKRFVGPLNSYRDVITIDESDEKFIQNIRAVKKKIEEEILKKTWIGITEPDTIGAPFGYSLWVILPEEVFGKYWYRVKTVEITPNEIRLKLEILRSVKGEQTHGNTSGTTENNSTISLDNFNFRDCLNEIRDKLKLALFNLYLTLTYENVKDVIVFLILLSSTIFAGCIKATRYILEFSLRFMREASNLIKNLTPIINSSINMLGNIVFGCFSLILRLVALLSAKQPVNNSYYTLNVKDPRLLYNSYSKQSNALPYYPVDESRSTVFIRQIRD